MSDLHKVIFTTHDTTFYVDGKSGELRHGTAEAHPRNVSVVINENTMEIIFEEKTIQKTINFGTNSSYLSNEVVPQNVVFEIKRLHDNHVALCHSGLYLAAEIDGRVTLSRTKVQHWETFRILDESADSVYTHMLRIINPGPEYVLDELEYCPDSGVDIIAFYLPQFYPIPENDKAWGEGFTEWTNVTKSLPRFASHYQPRLPGSLGFYDLRMTDTLTKQLSLAHRYGIKGFCLHHYWFSGQPLLDGPINFLISNPNIDIKFCVCWANESWTRRWDGGNKQIIVEQTYSEESGSLLAKNLIPLVKDPRYINCLGRPLILVYRPSVIPDISEFIRKFRNEFEISGVKNPYIVMCQTYGDSDPRPYGLDAAVEFPPHEGRTVPILDVNSLIKFDPLFNGYVREYRRLIETYIALPKQEYVQFHSVSPSWDNSARQANSATIYLNSTPALYGKWLAKALERTADERQPGERFVFVNAWNEWAEGAYLEPDRHFGYAYLSETRKQIKKFASKNNSTGHGTRPLTVLERLEIGSELSWAPDRLVPYHHWAGHIPFAFWLTRKLRPTRVVELGTHSGNSYSAFCQAIKHDDISCAATAIDSWAGDIHMNVTDNVYIDLKQHHDARYANFSTLLKSDFESARPLFENFKIDLLHIDGTHTYEAVKKDFETWSPLLSDSSIVLFHDTQERQESFGVWQYWKELSERYPNFEFTHSHGLGVLGYGNAFPSAITELFDIRRDHDLTVQVRNIFSAVGDIYYRFLEARR